MTIEVCFICQQNIEETDSFKEFRNEQRKLIVHEDCIQLFGELVKYAFQSSQSDSVPCGKWDLTNLPSIQKEEDTEYDAILKLLQWSSVHYPQKGLIPKELDEISKDQYRWVLSNTSARLGELLEQGKVRRIREGKTFRYFAN